MGNDSGREIGAVLRLSLTSIVSISRINAVKAIWTPGMGTVDAATSASSRLSRNVRFTAVARSSICGLLAISERAAFAFFLALLNPNVMMGEEEERW